MLTPKQYKALSILKQYPDGIVVGHFAKLFFTEQGQEYLITYAPRKGKLCAGSYLGKLKKKDFVVDRYVDEMWWKYFLTNEGRRAMWEYEKRFLYDSVTSIEESRALLKEGRDIYSADMYWQKNKLPETGGWYLYRVPDFEKQQDMDEYDRFFRVFNNDIARGIIVPAWSRSLSNEKSKTI